MIKYLDYTERDLSNTIDRASIIRTMEYGCSLLVGDPHMESVLSSALSNS